MDWHGYILLEKPPAMPMNAWENALNGLLRPLDKSPNDPQPARRLHTRTSLDGTKVIVESVFPEGRINAIRNNQAKVTRWAFGGEWMNSGDEVRAYLRANQSEWEPSDGKPPIDAILLARLELETKRVPTWVYRALALAGAAATAAILLEMLT